MTLNTEARGKPHHFTIDRSKWVNWATSHIFGSSRLLTSGFAYPAGQAQCCVGFYAESCGVPRSELLNVGAVDDAWPDKIKVPNRTLQRLYNINDCKTTLGGRDAREKLIVEEFSKHNVVVHFTGEYPEGADPW